MDSGFTELWEDVAVPTVGSLDADGGGNFAGGWGLCGDGGVGAGGCDKLWLGLAVIGKVQERDENRQDGGREGTRLEEDTHRRTGCEGPGTRSCTKDTKSLPEKVTRVCM